MVRLASLPLAPHRAAPVRRRAARAAPRVAWRHFVILKEPAVGRVKTRLEREFDSILAASCPRTMRTKMRAVLPRRGVLGDA